MAAPETSSPASPPPPKATPQQLFLFWGCFIALVATAFGFIIRTQILDDWQDQFGLTDTQKGEILGVGLWPFAISIVLFSLIIDAIGYGKAMIFAFVCHVGSAIVTIFTPQLAEMVAGGSGSDTASQEAYRAAAYWFLYGGTFMVALGNGTVEAVINPVVATLFPHAKTKWLSILHAGWPGGLVLGGILAITMGDADWQNKVALLFLPVIAYGIMMVFSKFPIHERVAANVSYRDMLREVGFFGALIVTGMISFELGRVLEESNVLFTPDAALLAGLSEQSVDVGGVAVTMSTLVKLGVAVAIAAVFGGATLSLGQPLFVFLLLIMVPLATTELGTDSWITSLMEPAMSKIGLNAGWVLIYTSAIMLVLRLFAAGPIVHALSPLGLLAGSSVLAALGLISLSYSAGIVILLAATLYGIGKTFFWPAMLGVTAEQFPRGGALTLNTVGGVGMLAVGVLGNPFLGNLQDTRVADRLQQPDGAEVVSAEEVLGEPRTSLFGEYRPLDSEKVDELDEEKQDYLANLQANVKQNALRTVAILPAIMFVCYMILIGYFKLQGGYRPKVLVTEHEEEEMMAGGTTGPADM